MGVSTDAILFYGHAFDTEGTKPWLFDQDEQVDEDDDADWEDRYAFLKGLIAPRELYPERWLTKATPYTAEEQRIIADWGDYWTAKRKLLAECPVEIGGHCSDECVMPYVAIKQSVQRASRGYPQKAVTDHPESIDWDRQIKDFCDLMGIGTDTPPQWWLVSWWG